MLGRDPRSERRTVRPRVGIVLQDSGFPPDLTVLEMMRMWAGTLTAPRPVGEALELDEPTPGLDPESRQGVWRLLRDLLDGAATILLSTHQMDEAESLADRLAIMHQGRVVRTGAPAEIAGGQAARISFGWPLGMAPELPVLPGGVTIQRTPGGWRCRPGPPAHRVRLLAWANHHDLRLNRFTARAASLQETFLAVAESGGAPHDEEWVG